MKTDNHMVLITGLSGSGKSTAAKCFEDLGYYVMDNLPMPLLQELLKDPGEIISEKKDIAVVIDLRAPGFVADFPAMMKAFDQEATPTVLFLESSEGSLVRRFSETRRPHPMAGTETPLVGIRREKEMLEGVRGMADMIFDTSEFSIHELRSKINLAFSPRTEEGGPGMVVSVMSFGFKYGVPLGTDLVFDVRFLPNPHFVPELKEQTGRDQPVIDYLHQHEEFHELKDRLVDLLSYLLPRYQREHRRYLSVAIGCTGGKHRSVGLSEEIYKELRDRDWRPRIEHRDIEK